GPEAIGQGSIDVVRVVAVIQLSLDDPQLAVDLAGHIDYILALDVGAEATELDGIERVVGVEVPLLTSREIADDLVSELAVHDTGVAGRGYEHLARAAAHCDGGPGIGERVFRHEVDDACIDARAVQRGARSAHDLDPLEVDLGDGHHLIGVYAQG